MLKIFSFGQNKCYKNLLFFISQAPTQHSFTFNSRFFYAISIRDSFMHFFSDHPSNDKRGGICVYFKSFLPIRILSIVILFVYIVLQAKT